MNRTFTLPTMAVFVPVPNAASWRWHWKFNTIDAYNVFGLVLQASTVVDQPMADELSAIAISAWNSFGKSNMHTSVTFPGTGVRDLRSPNNLEFIHEQVSTGGSAPGTLIPYSNAAVMTLRTGKAGRSYRGRIYFGGFTVDTLTDGTEFSTAVGSSLIAMMDQVVAGLAPMGIGLGVVSHFLPERTDKKGNVLPEKPAFITPVTSYVFRDRKYDTQRRRLA